MHAGVDQVAGGLHGFRAANAFEDGGHGIGMGQGVLARIQRLAGQQRLGKRAGAGQRVNLLGQGVGGGRNQLRQRLGLREGGDAWVAGFSSSCQCTFCDRPANRKFWTTATWSAAIKVGACPTPSNSTSAPWAHGLHGLGRFARQQVGLRPAQQQRLGLDLVVQLPQHASPGGCASWVKARNGTAIAGS
jgi:hypothetical protein